MSTKYFQPFEKIYYKFGDEVTYSLFQNLTQYVDIIDQVKSQTALYEDYTIKSGDRPDTLSLQLYGDPKYYWTFFLLNDDLRESGWPLKNEEVLKRTKEFYPNRVITITSDISSSEGGYDFRVGRVVIGNTSGTHGTIIKRNLDLGQIIVDTTHDYDPLTPDRTYTLDVNSNGAAEIETENTIEFFTDTSLWVMTKTNVNPDADDYNIPVSINNFTVELTEVDTKALIRSIPFQPNVANGDTFEYRLTVKILRRNEDESKYVAGEVLRLFDVYRDEIFPDQLFTETGLDVQKRVFREDAQYNAVHHYENANGEHVDIDPYNPTLPAGLTPITYLSRVQKKNDDLKQIKVLKPDVVETVVKEFYKLMNE